MLLNFKEWLESKRPVSVNSDVKKWLDSADKLKQTIEKLKAVLKNKKAEEDKPKVQAPIKVELPNKVKSSDEKDDKDKDKKENDKKENDKENNVEIKKPVQNPVIEKDKKDLGNGRQIK